MFGTSSYQIGKKTIMACCIIVSWASGAFAQQRLENPAPNSSQSGIGVISGWVCDAEKVQIRVDDQIFLNPVYGTNREDTREVCDDINNGFNILVNWNEVKAGVHTFALCVDDDCGSNIIVFVISYGARFLRGLDGTAIVACTNKLSPGFPTPTVFTWQESLQNWTIGLAPTCDQVDGVCAQLPSDPVRRKTCLDLIECCRL